MIININRTKNDFLNNILYFIEKERIKMILTWKSNSEYKFENPDNSIIVKFNLDTIHNKILYDVYLSEYNKHLKEGTLSNFEKMYSLQRQHGKWHLPKYLPDVLTLLDEIHIWAKNTNFTIKGLVMT
jgi:hypothetical protein